MTTIDYWTRVEWVLILASWDWPRWLAEKATQTGVTPMPALTSHLFFQILKAHGIPINKSSPVAQEHDLGLKFEVVGKHCAGILNQGTKKFGGTYPDGVLPMAVNCLPVPGPKAGPCTQVPGMVFVEIKNKFGILNGRDLNQGKRMIDWLSNQHQAQINTGYFPSLIYVTVADTVIPPNLIAKATSQRVRMAQYIVTYEDLTTDVRFCSLPVRQLNRISQPRRRMQGHLFAPTLKCVPLSLMKLSMMATYRAP